ncbi:MAG TPA: nucleotidyltransferase family protein [Spirochaetota bacterium]|nr:nucleotidyltransferase family protein [Spirochaetota bacterium]
MDREIRERLGKAKNYLGEKYRLSKIGVFGSYARGDEKPGSDIDILVEFSSTPDLFEFFEIEEYLERVLDRKIDLVREKAIKKQMKDEIMKEVVFL